MKNKKNPPFGVKFISILTYIGSGLIFLIAIFFLILGITIFSSPTSMPLPSEIDLGIFGSLSEFTGTFSIFITFILILFSILVFFIARYLWKGRVWARILVIVFSILGVLSSLISLFQGDFSSLWGLIINFLIAWYLLFNLKAKKFFK